MGEDFSYAEAFKGLDVEALKRDLIQVMTHVAGLVAGRLRPLRAVLHPHDLARGRYVPHRRRPRRRWQRHAALCPAEQLAGQRQPRQGAPAAVADQAEVRQQGLVGRPDRPGRQRRHGGMGFKTFGFGFGREDVWEPDEIVWGPEDTWLGDERYAGDRELQGSVGAVQMGLIYVNPEGPNGNAGPAGRCTRHPRDVPRMAMNDEETVALIAGGHTFGKTHGAAPGGPGRSGARGRRSRTGLRLAQRLRHRQGRRRCYQRPGGRLDQRPGQVGQRLLREPARHEWKQTTSPAGAKQWVPTRLRADHTRRARPVEDAPAGDAHDRPRAEDRPGLRGRSRSGSTRTRSEFADAFARAWYKLLHRDMGPVTRYLGPWVPEPQLWQDPVPAADDARLINEADVTALKAKILGVRPVDLAARFHGLGGGI